jgi:hypothetical protein
MCLGTYRANILEKVSYPPPGEYGTTIWTVLPLKYPAASNDGTGVAVGAVGTGVAVAAAGIAGTEVAVGVKETAVAVGVSDPHATVNIAKINTVTTRNIGDSQWR